MSVVTFLFTDIEGSTRRWEADPDAMRAAVEAHNKALRDAVEANDGKVFNYTGDGMCAVFDSPRSAVDAAVDAQRALELPVRMGIATGEAELRGGDYFGTVLNRTARVMAAGRADEHVPEDHRVDRARRYYCSPTERRRPDPTGIQAITGYRQARGGVSGMRPWITDRVSTTEDR